MLRAQTTTDIYGDDARAYVRAPSGLILPEAVAEARYAPRTPKAVELFAGAGGMACGLKQAGWHVVAACEWDCSAVLTYATNLCRYGELKMHFVEPADRERMEKLLQKSWKRASKKGIAQFPTAGSGWISTQPGMPGTEHLFIGDIRKLSGKTILDAIGMKKGELDCVAGGPPCQGFSMAGKRNVHDPRNSMVFEFARLVLELHPKTIVFENVPGIVDMVTPEGVPVVDALCRVLQDGGFGTLDALRKSIGHQTGAVGLMRGKRAEREKLRRDAREEDEPAPDQIDLFDGLGLNRPDQSEAA